MPNNNQNNNNQNNNNQNHNNNQQQQTPKPENPAIAEAARQVKADREEVSKDEAALVMVAKPLYDDFAKSPEMIAATTALQDAQKATKAANVAVTASLASDPAFQAATKKKEDASQQLHKLREVGAAPDELAQAASVVMEAGAVVTKMQAAAENGDPNLMQSRKDMVVADSKITELQKQNQESIRKDAGWIAAKKTLDDARAKLAISQAALAALRTQ